jgi:hypothetical protein
MSGKRDAVGTLTMMQPTDLQCFDAESLLVAMKIEVHGA